jgi:hypothetical protein
MRANSPGRKRGRDATGTGSTRPGRARAIQGGARVSAVVVLILIVATTVLSLYDLRLLISLLGP